jgi:hypothetical protein
MISMPMNVRDHVKAQTSVVKQAGDHRVTRAAERSVLESPLMTVRGDLFFRIFPSFLVQIGPTYEMVVLFVFWLPSDAAFTNN